ncbi:MAG: hypothetical protein ACTHKX_09200 [Pseudolysinimonas sp.]
MDKRQRIALGSGLAIAAAIAGGLAITHPAQAASGQHAPASPSGAVEDGTNDGETNDDGAVEDGTNDGETNDDGTDASDPADNGVEDGTNDGETNDD